jgi:hypothetical protein
MTEKPAWMGSLQRSCANTAIGYLIGATFLLIGFTTASLVGAQSGEPGPVGITVYLMGTYLFAAPLVVVGCVILDRLLIHANPKRPTLLVASLLPGSLWAILTVRYPESTPVTVWLLATGIAWALVARLPGSPREGK